MHVPPLSPLLPRSIDDINSRIRGLFTLHPWAASNERPYAFRMFDEEVCACVRGSDWLTRHGHATNKLRLVVRVSVRRRAVSSRAVMTVVP